MAELLGVQDERAHMALLESPRRVRPEGDVYLLIGIPKGQAMDLAVRMATEAGATVIQPVLSQRCIARGDRLDRWQRIAGSAAQQCGRAELPDIRELCPLREGMRAIPDGIQKYVALPGSTQTVSPHQGAAILIGPEGGLTEQEADRALQEGWTPISLGPWVLRAETAAAVGVAALVNQLETMDAD